MMNSGRVKNAPNFKMKITIENRELRPWHFPPSECEVQRGHLKTGDYALYGDFGFAIERKSVSDFAQTVLTGWQRFNREIHRMEGWPAKIIIVEGKLSDFLFWQDSAGTICGPAHDVEKLTPALATLRLAELLYSGVSVLFAENPGYAAVLCLKILRERERELNATQRKS